MATAKNFNRASEDVGNILGMEHVNVTVPDQTLATYFYVNGLGFTRDPYIDFGPFNVWVNVGAQQFHLPTNKAQVVRGHVGVVVPNIDELEGRLSRMGSRLKDTSFNYRRNGDTITVTCPWGNQIKCHGPGKFGAMTLGIPYVEFLVPQGTCAGITRFYERVFNCRTTLKKSSCEIAVGKGQQLRFKESRKQIDYDGHHIAIYVVNFSSPHSYLKDRGLITEESDAHQYRFQTIIDPKTGRKLFDIEHEVRSLHHPMFDRNLVNRNAEQSFFNYKHGRDAFVP
jgi:catechol 2,3-dioxygenase-like lactoylglutathione lyase family enzyme